MLHDNDDVYLIKHFFHSFFCSITIISNICFVFICISSKLNCNISPGMKWFPFLLMIYAWLLNLHEKLKSFCSLSRREGERGWGEGGGGVVSVTFLWSFKEGQEHQVIQWFLDFVAFVHSCMLLLPFAYLSSYRLFSCVLSPYNLCRTVSFSCVFVSFIFLSSVVLYLSDFWLCVQSWLFLSVSVYKPGQPKLITTIFASTDSNCILSGYSAGLLLIIRIIAASMSNFTFLLRIWLSLNWHSTAFYYIFTQLH